MSISIKLYDSCVCVCFSSYQVNVSLLVWKDQLIEFILLKEQQLPRTDLSLYLNHIHVFESRAHETSGRVLLSVNHLIIFFLLTFFKFYFPLLEISLFHSNAPLPCSFHEIDKLIMINLFKKSFQNEITWRKELEWNTLICFVSYKGLMKIQRGKTLYFGEEELIGEILTNRFRRRGEFPGGGYPIDYSTNYPKCFFFQFVTSDVRFLAKKDGWWKGKKEIQNREKNNFFNFEGVFRNIVFEKSYLISRHFLEGRKHSIFFFFSLSLVTCDFLPKKMDDEREKKRNAKSWKKTFFFNFERVFRIIFKKELFDNPPFSGG